MLERQKTLLGLGFRCECARCLDELSNDEARELSTHLFKIEAERAMTLRKNGDTLQAVSVLDNCWKTCTDVPSPFGIRDSTLELLQALICMYTESGRFAEARKVGTTLKTFLQPFCLQSPLFLTVMVKNATGEVDAMKELMPEIRRVSMIQNGGGLNILLDRYQLDFKCLGA